MGLTPTIKSLRRSARFRHTLERVSIRTVLVLGFGLLLLFWIFSSGDLVRRVTEVEQRTSQIDRRFMSAEEQLLTIRTQILLASVYLRDAMLDTPDTADAYRERLHRSRDAVEAALAKYKPIIDAPSERETFSQLQVEIQDFWATVLPALRWDTERRAVLARALLRERVIPKRQLIISISGRVQGLNRAAFDEQQAAVEEIYGAMRRRVWDTSVAVFVLGLLVAVIVIRQVGRLETRIVEQSTRESRTRENLQRLSAKLVTAQEEERRSIARELHDEIGQALTAIKVELAIVERSLDAEARHRNVLGEARAITDHALQTVRDLSQLLHPPLIDDLGLVAALDWYVAGFSRRTAIPAQFTHEGIHERLAPELEMCLYRITQEALTNIARHAAARSCRVRLQKRDETIVLDVVDDGKGFDLDEVLSPVGRRGLGLLGVQERVAEFGGEFRVESGAEGTTVTVQLPALTAAPSVETAPSESTGEA